MRFRYARLAMVLMAVASTGWGQRIMERLDRGVVAVRLGESGVYVGWRLLGTDPEAITFDLYRDGEKLNKAPIAGSTNFVDKDGTAEAKYEVCAVLEGKVAERSAPTPVWGRQYHDIPLNPPPVFALPDGRSRDYAAGDASVADLDGDGQYELVLKWVGVEHDNSHSGYTSPVILEGLELDGTSLWRINLGINVRAGAHYTQFMAYDLDSDGRAEVACGTADGSVDGAGTVIGDAAADYRREDGKILTGPEFLTVFDGKTGAALATVPFQPARGDVRVWGDDSGNRSDRHLACIACLDGIHPSLIMARGYYRGRREAGPGRTAIAAWDWRDGALRQRWQFDTLDRPEYEGYIGQGNHAIAAGDVDGDGKDEILYGAMAVDDDGSGLYTTGYGHGDAHHFSDLDPAHPGLEMFTPHETARPGRVPGMSLRDAGTGEILWGTPVSEPRDVGRGACDDIFAQSPGAEAWGMDRNLYSAKGEVVGPAPSAPPNFFAWWDGDLVREILNRNYVAKYDPAAEGAMVRILTADGCTSINGTKATPVISADLLGDWREEIVWRTEDGSALRLYTTVDPTAYRLPTLMHDPIYRLSVAWQNVAYNQPPHPGFFLGDGMTPPPRPNITVP